MNINFILDWLVDFGIIPKSVVPIIPILEKDAPAAEELIETLIKVINDMEANNVPHTVAVKTVVTQLQQPRTINQSPFNPAVPR